MNNKFKAIYQDYDWCYENYITKGLSHQEMADLCGATKRVIEKWCSDKYKLNNHTFKYLAKLTPIQKQLIIWGTLGDGHIDKRETQHMYIESHAEGEKDYLFWKYNILKNLCNKEPSVIKDNNKIFFGKEYHAQKCYRVCTRIVNQLEEILNMSKIEKIDTMDNLGLSLFLLDDGSRDTSNWNLCVASFTKEEKNFFVDKCKQLFDIDCWIVNKDDRYITFSSDSSRKIDSIILSVIPNDLDIIYKKILNKNISNKANYKYVIVNNEKMGLSTYCKTVFKSNKQNKYNKIYEFMIDNDIKEIDNKKVKEIIEE